jgi:uncharacterized protein (TIGR02996 family)
MNDAAFLQAILDDPDDDSPRLVYADWLEEHGGAAQQARAEFIRLQCALADDCEPPWHRPFSHREAALQTLADLTREADVRRQKLARRRDLLQRDHRDRWLAGEPKWLQAVFRRGFVEHVGISVWDFFESAEALFDRHPIRGVELTGPTEDHLLKGVAHCPTLRRARELYVGDSNCTGWGVAALAESPHAAGLTALGLTASSLIGAAGATALAESPHLAGLRALDLSGAYVTDPGAEALCGAPHLTRLTTLGLGSNGIGEAGARQLAGAANLAGLTRLDLTNNPLGDGGVRALMASAYLVGLTALDLGLTFLGDDGCVALAESPQLGRLTTLNLADNLLGEEGVRALAGSPYLAHLTALDLSGCDLGDVEALLLAQSPNLGNLTVLRLGDRRRRAPLTAAGVRALVESPFLPRLADLDVTHLGLDVGAILPVVAGFRGRVRLGP